MKERQILESWKEISNYLKRSIKTCQRWEVELGLPIHRLDGTPSARVFAYADELDRWIAVKLKSPEAKAQESVFVRHQWKKWVLITVGTLGLLVAIAALIWQLFLQQPVSFPSTRPIFSFLPLENVTGDEIIETWKTAIPFLMFIDLVQSRAVGSALTPISQVLKSLKLSEAQKYSAEDLKKIGEKTRCDYLATGSLIRSGEDIILNLSLHDSRTAAVIHSFRTMSPGEKGIFRMIDGLSREIKLAVNVPRRLVVHDIDEDIAKITTGSLEAFKIFMQGERLVEQRKVPEASSMYKKALEIDPKFGEAYLSLYFMASGSGAKEEAVRYGRKVLGLLDRINTWSRYIFLGHYYWWDVQRDCARSMAAWRKNWELLGDEYSGHCLADAFLQLEELTKAIPIYETLIKKSPMNSTYIGHLADCFVDLGEYDKAERIIDDYLSSGGAADAELMSEELTIALLQKKFDVARTVLDRLHNQYPRSEYAHKYSSGTIFLTRDDFVNAEKEYQKIAEQGDREEKVCGFYGLIAVYLSQGRIEDAKEQARLAIDAAKQLGLATNEKESHYSMAYLHRISGSLPGALEEIEQACQEYDKEGWNAIQYLQLRALILLEMGRTEEFEIRLAELKTIIEREQHPKLMRAYYYLLGHRELLKRRFAKAIEHLFKAVSFLIPGETGYRFDADSAQYWWSLGEAYYLAGRCESALYAFNRISPFWDMKLYSGDVYARSFYRIAQLREQCGRRPGAASKPIASVKEMAVENYRKFLSLCKDADPIFAAEVEDAKKRLAVLEAELRPAD